MGNPNSILLLINCMYTLLQMVQAIASSALIMKSHLEQLMPFLATRRWLGFE